jgi:hypothetical protein
MSVGSEREGGDINLNAGDGADDDGLGNTASGGGDIIIDAGNLAVTEIQVQEAPVASLK